MSYADERHQAAQDQRSAWRREARNKDPYFVNELKQLEIADLGPEPGLITGVDEAIGPDKTVFVFRCACGSEKLATFDAADEKWNTQHASCVQYNTNSIDDE